MLMASRRPRASRAPGSGAPRSGAARSGGGAATAGTVVSVGTLLRIGIIDSAGGVASFGAMRISLTGAVLVRAGVAEHPAHPTPPCHAAKEQTTRGNHETS